MHKVRSTLLLVLLSSTLFGCQPEHDSPTSEILINDLPSNGVLIEVSDDGDLTNIKEVDLSLETSHKEKFNISLQWLATESEVSFYKLDGKSAHEIVQIANCLKTPGKNESDCI
ncbi:hypothetical protein [Photobacterium alginatilyticum]|uniref:Uncharacterized protein n=1 Tax=Photobacterium alginatilyticum TaxID=1775171 RepID=A0ABW9YQU5_9GAMM|nr:hypothetical protein [Photobacterium alginatilyticum]NBI56303.1 hypothetical protein [Photobacterium alginatilyticum]